MPSTAKKLTAAQRAFVVQRLAAYDSHDDVVASVRALFGITLTSQSVSYYDPTSRAGRNLPQNWRERFVLARGRVRDAARRHMGIRGSCPRCELGVRATPAQWRAVSEAARPQFYTDEQRMQALLVLLHKVKADPRVLMREGDYERWFAEEMRNAELRALAKERRAALSREHGRPRGFCDGGMGSAVTSQKRRPSPP
jgi:hypothetical protein